MSLRSNSYADWAAEGVMPAAMRESTSAMTLDVPSTNTRLLVYSDMNARWRCWGREVGGDTLLRVKSKACSQSKAGRVSPPGRSGMLISETAARSFLSKME
jgi:hypothetical protein